MANNSYQWLNERTMPRKVAGIYEVDPLTSIATQVSSLSNQLATLTSQGAYPQKQLLLLLCHSLKFR
jgi:hypothetical protein